MSVKKEQFIQKPPGLTIEIGAITKEDQLVTCGSCGPDLEADCTPEPNDSDWSLMSGSQWRAKMSTDGGRGDEKPRGSDGVEAMKSLVDRMRPS